MADSGRINSQVVKDEIECLRKNWHQTTDTALEIDVDKYIGQPIVLLEQKLLTSVIKICQQSVTAAEAGRTLCNYSASFISYNQMVEIL
ncbi:MAG: hypothetical protein GQ532_18535 [Methylomarinum sp.]|nr:hypothetical protein [Methylomarinum sp.]